MGVPYYFKYLTTNVSDAVLTTIPGEKLILCLDFNSMIYEAKATICASGKIDSKFLLEYYINEEVIRLIKKLLESLTISRVAKLYIAIDGIAPMAKIVQQRQRRFKSAFERERLATIAKEEGVEPKGTEWDSNVITPGTKFMNRLNTHLEGFVSYCKALNPDLEIILDDSNNMGEGEHKLLHWLEQNRTDFRDYTKVIYGLDADLIILTILRGFSRLYLYRESHYYPQEIRDQGDYLFMDVSVFRKSIINDYWLDGLMDTEQRLIVDYIFITFLLGNDFLPNLFILKIQQGGFEMLNELYLRGFERFKCHLVSKDLKIRKEFLLFILRGLLKMEDAKLTEFRADWQRYKPFIKYGISNYERRCQMQHFYPKVVGEKDTVMIGERGWHDRFYRYWLDFMPDAFVKEGMLNNYFDGLSWILHYYIHGVPDWKWHYRFPITPSIRDIVSFLEKKTEPYIESEWSGEKLGKNANVYQLMLVLPKSSLKCIPKEWRYIHNYTQVKYLHPSKFPIKTLYKRYFHECIPVLPDIELSYFETIDFILTKSE